eukprot:365370-Chlamydomonas_euryale.AAC.10
MGQARERQEAISSRCMLTPLNTVCACGGQAGVAEMWGCSVCGEGGAEGRQGASGGGGGKEAGTVARGGKEGRSEGRACRCGGKRARCGRGAAPGAVSLDVEAGYLVCMVKGSCIASRWGGGLCTIPDIVEAGYLVCKVQGSCMA